MIYTYKHPKKEEYVEIVQSMFDTHEYSKDGVKWIRVFDAPQLSIDTNINEFSESDFVNKTKQKKGTVGDLMDLSKELSEKRTAKAGNDSVQKEFFKEYKKKRKGTTHPNDPSRMDKLNKLGASATYLK
jgi:hypothetical protein